MIAVADQLPETRCDAEPNAPVADDRELIRRCRGGDRRALETMVRQHQAKIARTVQRLLGWPAEVEDVVQDVFAVAIEKMGNFRGDSALRTWLTAIAIDRCRRHRRKRLLRSIWQWRSRQVPGGLDSDPVEAPLIDAETAAAVQRAVRNLPAKYREVIVLRYLEEFEIEQIGKFLNLSRSAIDVRLHRAREMLRESLGDL